MRISTLKSHVSNSTSNGIGKERPDPKNNAEIIQRAAVWRSLFKVGSGSCHYLEDSSYKNVSWFLAGWRLDPSNSVGYENAGSYEMHDIQQIK